MDTIRRNEREANKRIVFEAERLDESTYVTVGLNLRTTRHLAPFHASPWPPCCHTRITRIASLRETVPATGSSETHSSSKRKVHQLNSGPDNIFSEIAYQRSTSVSYFNGFSY